MTRHHAVRLLCVCLFVLTGCTQISIAEEERLRSTTTALAETVVPVKPATTEVAETEATPQPTAAPTNGPTAAPTSTPQPTGVALPPTPAPDAALKNFSLCDQVAGDPAGGRFSARVTAITTTLDPKFERLEIGLNVPDNSVAPHALARCLSAADDPQANGGGYTLLLNFGGWLHDALFRASTVTPTVSLSGTQAIGGVSYRVPSDADAGADIAIALKQPLPYRVALEQNPTRLVLEVAKTTPITGTSDMLTQASGNAPTASAPLFYLQDGDVWSYTNGKATNLTNSPEVESAISVSNAAKQIAFCRSEAGAAADDALAASSLWTMGLDGSNPQQLAAPGRTCADPAFSPDGKTIAFTVDEGSSTPPRLSIYTVPSEGGDATRLTPASDEWSRFGARWLDAQRLVYAAQAEDTRSTLFINSAGSETDIGAALTVGNTYANLGAPVVAPDGSGIAVEGIRADGSGANMLLLDGKGVKTNEIANGYWTRPLAWSDDGTLFYLSTDCPSSVAQNYSLFQQPKGGQPGQIAYGITLGGFGQFAASGKTLAYVALEHVAPGPRGPLAVDPLSASSMWLWDVSTGARAKLVDAKSAIGGVAR